MATTTKRNRAYTILLLRPDYIGHAYGQDAVCLWVMAPTAVQALRKARNIAVKLDGREMSCRGDYYCLLALRGHVESWDNGRGGVLRRDSSGRRA